MKYTAAQERRELASILRAMIEGSYCIETLYTDAPIDGDCFIARAADLLEQDAKMVREREQAQPVSVPDVVGHPRRGVDPRDEIELFLRDAYAKGANAARRVSMVTALEYARREAPKLRAAIHSPTAPAVDARDAELRSVVSDIRAHCNPTNHESDDEVSPSYALSWADRIDAAIAKQKGEGVMNTKLSEEARRWQDRYMEAVNVITALTAERDGLKEKIAAYEAARGDAEAQAGDADIAYVISDRNINGLQVNSILTLIERAKHAHYVNVYLRINGRDEMYEADWIKHMAATAKQKGE